MTRPKEVVEHERHQDAQHRAEREREEERRGVERVEGFSDGVFAIAITLLILNLEAPRADIQDARELADEIRAQLPQFGVFALSFWVIGRYWVAHHNTFAYIRRYDGVFLTLNLALLFVIVFLPYPTELVGEFGGQEAFGVLPVVIYAGSIVALSLVSSLLWRYATSGHRLVAPDLDPLLIRHVQLRSIAPAIVFGGSIPLAFWHPEAALVTWAAFFPLLRLGLRRRERRDRQASGRGPTAPTT